MKKIIYTLLVAVLALSFMGCPTVYDDLNFEELVATPAFIQGDMAGEAAAMTVNGNVATYTFKYDETMTAWAGSNGKINFKVSAKKGPDGKSLDWDNAWSDAAITINGEPVFTESKNGGNNTCEGLSVGEEYTITVTSGRTGVTMAITGKVAEVEAADADLSAINATTMAQAGAYISINGDAWSDATVGKYFFNKKGDNYVAVIPFDIPADAKNGWDDTAYQAWGKIGVGDNKTVKADEKQFGYAEGTLHFNDTANIDLDNIVAGTKGVITVTATADGCTCVATVY